MERGHVLSFRLPSDTPDHILKYLQNLKDTEGRKFSKKITGIFFNGIAASTQQESISIPLHQPLTKEQREWLKHEQTETLIRNVFYQLLSEPTSSVEIKVPEMIPTKPTPEPIPPQKEETGNGLQNVDDLDSFDDLDNFQFDFSAQREEEVVEEIEDDPLGDFFAVMNK
jgi:hypothetical protein